jgi:DNA polymerase III, epsilon subunit and related 3''-5'' exonucleases
LIEAAWLRVNDLRSLEVEEQFVQRYRPEKKIELGAIAVHHILDEDLADCPPANTFHLPSETEYLVGHSIDFDWEVIGRPEVKRICTYAMSRRLWPEVDSFSQSALLYHFSKDRKKNAGKPQKCPLRAGRRQILSGDSESRRTGRAAGQLGGSMGVQRACTNS